MQRAEIEAARRDFVLALDDYGEKVIKLQPDNRNAYRGRMRIKEMQNDFAGAMMERVRMTEKMGSPFAGPAPTNGSFLAGNPGRGRDRQLQQLDRVLQPTPTSPGILLSRCLQIAYQRLAWRIG